MIVRAEPNRLRCITQRDHARLAAAVVEAWRADGMGERRTRDLTLFATRHHDDGWEEEDAAPAVNPATALPFDYLTLPPSRRDLVWTRSIAQAGRRSAYAAALVAQHAAALTRAFGRDGSWDALAARFEAERDRWFTADPVTADDVPPGERLFFLRDYAMLAMGDLVSLMACGGSHEASREGYDLLAEGDGVVVVSPDPFEGAVLRATVPARRLALEACSSDAALAEAWRHAPVLGHPVTVMGRQRPELS